MTRINSRQKGAAGEREAANFLNSLGFTARRAVQNGVTDGRDIVVDDLPNLYFEVKRSQSVSMETSALMDAIMQAEKKAKGRASCVLWRRNNERWKMTFVYPALGAVTVYHADDICKCLKMLNKEGAGDE